MDEQLVVTWVCTRCNDIPTDLDYTPKMALMFCIKCQGYTDHLALYGKGHWLP